MSYSSRDLARSAHSLLKNALKYLYNFGDATNYVGDSEEKIYLNLIFKEPIFSYEGATSVLEVEDEDGNILMIGTVKWDINE